MTFSLDISVFVINQDSTTVLVDVRKKCTSTDVAPYPITMIFQPAPAWSRGKILSCGAQLSDYVVTDECFLYSPESNKWTVAPPINYAR